MAMAEVEYIYKIVPSSVDLPITSSRQLPKDYVLPVSDLDKNSTFIHMSTVAQIPNTLKLFFKTSSSSRDSIYILKVPYKPLEDKKLVRWEDPDGKVARIKGAEGVFPHIHDGHQYKLGHNEVESVIEIVSEHGEDDWDAALSRTNDWLR
jgi:uncharacterized protein (DUF952 family)